MSGLERWHGTRSGYINHACRCADCRDANRAYSTSLRMLRRSQRIEVDGRLVHPQAPHGTINGYTNYTCRCLLCTEHKRLAEGQR